MYMETGKILGNCGTHISTDPHKRLLPCLKLSHYFVIQSVIAKKYKRNNLFSK